MQELSIKNEFSPLKKVVVAWGNSLVNSEFNKETDLRWDQQLLLEQQRSFFDLLTRYNIELIFAQTNPELPQQMYTRDTGFVCASKFFYCAKREFQEREGEIKALDNLLSQIDPVNIIPITEGRVEGGDVLINDGEILMGISSRTDTVAAAFLQQHFPVKTLFVGDSVMHLDTRLTLLPNNYALVFPDAFNKEDFDFISQKFKLIPVTESEAKDLGTNVFILNPETIVVAKQHPRVQDELTKVGFKLEIVDYSEPIKNNGSFRCTTMPLVRGE